MKDKTYDPKGVIFEAYRIEGINSSQCRSIFLDWALSIPNGVDPKDLIKTLLTQYGDDTPDHPMTEVLQQGLQTMQAPGRRGGWRSRPRN